MDARPTDAEWDLLPSCVTDYLDAAEGNEPFCNIPTVHGTLEDVRIVAFQRAEDGTYDIDVVNRADDHLETVPVAWIVN